MVQPRFLQALSGVNKGRPPVWFMRQAGRYLPSYRALRERASFETMSHRPDLITEVTLLPFREFSLDAAILFSDILLILEAFGCRVRYVEGTGPVVEGKIPLPTPIRIDEQFQFLDEGIRLLKKELSVPLIGFAGGPFTVACYAVEAKSSPEFRSIKRLLYQDPLTFQTLLNQLTDATIDLLLLQVRAGVDAIQLFDTWANLLPAPLFKSYCLPIYQKILDALRPTKVPVILFCRGSSYFAPWMASLEPEAIGIDTQGDLPTLRASLPKSITLQGNLDPELLFAPPEMVQAETRALLQGMEGDPGFILNLGHGILPQTPLESVHAILDCLHAPAVEAIR